MNYSIAVLKGDGIGPEIVDAALGVLDKVGTVYGHQFHYNCVDVGGCAIDKFGEPLPKASLDVCLSSDSVLLGAVGGPKWDDLPVNIRPEKALLGLRKELGLYANLRPALLMPQLKDASPLKDRVIGDGLDIMVVRELTGGIYFGEKGDGENFAYDTEKYYDFEVERIARTAFEIAMKRGKRVTSVDKANVLNSSKFWRGIVEKVHGEYPEIELNHMYVDNAAMQIATNPRQFDVIVTSNMFGDILSDLAATITGSIGMLASASTGDGTRGMYEPIHGSAPDIAGMDKANPIATIISVAMMLRTAFGLTAEADTVERAVEKALDAGYRTGDIMSDGMTLVGTKKMGEVICGFING